MKIKQLKTVRVVRLVVKQGGTTINRTTQKDGPMSRHVAGIKHAKMADGNTML